VVFEMLNHSLIPSPFIEETEIHNIPPHEISQLDEETDPESVDILAEEFLQLHGSLNGTDGIRLSSMSPTFSYEYDTHVAPDSRARSNKGESNITAIASPDSPVQNRSDEPLPCSQSSEHTKRNPIRLNDWDWPSAWVVSGHPNPMKTKLQLASGDGAFWFVVVSRTHLSQ
jgi:hypothetical protein